MKTKPEVSLNWIASRSGAINDEQLEQIQRWLDADWESHDINRDAIRLIGRLVSSLRDAYAPGRERDARLADADERRLTAQKDRHGRSR